MKSPVSGAAAIQLTSPAIMLHLFSLAFRARPLKALEAMWWLITRRRVRGRTMLVRSAACHRNYYDWSARKYEKAALSRQGRLVLERPPIFVLEVSRGSSTSDIGATVDSVLQVFAEADCLGLLDEGENRPATDSDPRLIAVTRRALIDRLKNVDAPVIFLRSGDRLSALAEVELTAALGAYPPSTIVYWDEDRVDGEHRSSPWLKPQWNKLQFLGQDYVSFSCALPAALVVRALSQIDASIVDVPAMTAWALLSGLAADIVKIDAVLLHRTTGSRQPTTAARLAVIAEFAPTFRVEPQPLLPVDRVSRPLHGVAPSVAMIVPTRDHVDLLEPCIRGLLSAEYPGRKDIVIIDNGSSDAKTLAYLEQAAAKGIRVIRDDGPFNYAALNNHAVSLVDTDFVCFVNNDVEPTENRWLDIMTGFAVEENVGAVGARLLYPDMTIQHAGVAIGMGGAAGHILRARPNDPELHHGLIAATRYTTAVTAACLVVSKRKFEEVGGFDERQLAVAFNDVDLCLKLHHRGYENVYAADAILIHHESKTRGLDATGEKKRRFAGELACLKERWATETWQDPYYHPRFDRSDEWLGTMP